MNRNDCSSNAAVIPFSRGFITSSQHPIFSRIAGKFTLIVHADRLGDD